MLLEQVLEACDGATAPTCSALTVGALPSGQLGRDTGGGHCGAGNLAPAAWQFFKEHPYGVSPEPWAGGLPPGFPGVCSVK